MTLFNPNTLHLHALRARKSFEDHAFLFKHVSQELEERAVGMKKSFNHVLEISPHSLQGSTHVSEEEGRGLKKNSFDLILSFLLAHWMNDLPGFLTNIQASLRADGLFLGALWGGNTLYELRESLLSAELTLTGGASPRVIPMLQPSDAPLLLKRAGFLNPIVDTEVLTVTYPSLISLMKDLRGMGETNKLTDRLKTFTPRHLFKEAEEEYLTSFGLKDGSIPATFEVIYLTGWRRAAT